MRLIHLASEELSWVQFRHNLTKTILHRRKTKHSTYEERPKLEILVIEKIGQIW